MNTTTNLEEAMTTTAPTAYKDAALLWQLLMDPELKKCTCQVRSENPKNCPLHGHLFPAK